MAEKKKGVGKGWHADPEGHARAGRKGGQTTAAIYGTAFYSRIGKLGGKKSPGNFKNDPQRARDAGAKGGRSRARAAAESEE